MVTRQADSWKNRRDIRGCCIVDITRLREASYQASNLPNGPRGKEALHEFLVRLRLS